MCSFSCADQLIQDILKLLSKEYRYNCRWSLICSKSVIISRISCRFSEQICMYINRFHNAGKYKKELCILMRCLTWFEKIDSIICSNRPVVVLTGSVNSCERFLVKQTFQPMLTSYSLQCLHCQLILIYSDISFCINRSQLMLCRCNLVMLCL